jgi:hypothetical protein
MLNDPANLNQQINDRNQIIMRYNLSDASDCDTRTRALLGFSRENLIDGSDSTVALGW